jgi:iron complex outermembrane receptor protein
MHKYSLLSAFALLISATGFTQETKNNEELYAVNDTVKSKGGILKEVIVTNKTKIQPTVVRSSIKPMDLPQSVQVITGAIIEQQQSVRLSDVVKNANGVYVGSARGGAQESFWSRGYDMTANNMFKNGFRFNGGSIPEVASLDKVEILKGSSALLYGNVAPGGILNMVTKTPSFKKGGEIGMQAGSYNFYKPSLDIYGPLNQSIAYRFVGTYENSESFRDVVKKERYYVNPSFLIKVSEKTEIILQGDYLNDDWTPDFGTAIIKKDIIDLPRNLYMGADWSNGKTKQATISGMVKHDFNSNWKLNFNTSFQDYSRIWKGTERIQPSDNGNWSRPLGQNRNEETIASEQLSIQGNFATSTIKHQLFTGTDFENAVAEAYTFTFTPSTYGTGNIFNFENFNQGTGIPESTTTRIVKTTTNRFGIYAQDLISITEKVKVLAGIRWSWQESQPITKDVLVNTTTDGVKQKDIAFSPRIGIVYQPTKNNSLFASYSDSFTPNTGTTVDGKVLDPSIIKQYEVGVKNDFWKGLFSANVTLYQIINDNLAQTAEFKANGSINTDTTIKVLSGETKSKGVEIDITARPIIGFNINAGYSYNDMRYTKTSGTNGSFIVGDRLVRTPANTANMSFFYTLSNGKLKGTSFGVIGNYIGKRIGGWNNQVVIDPTTFATSINDREIPLSDYTSIDFSVGYNWKKLSLLCKLSNITNELNYTVHENYSANPIAPRQVLTSLKYKF